MTDNIDDGRHDFDFFHGRWHTVGRKLVDVTDRTCSEWVEFEGAGECRPILGGLGNVDTLTVPALPPGGQPMDGATLRLFDPATGIWRIWWMSSRMPGVLDTPVAGRFDGGRGIFEGPDEFDGVPVLVRFEWHVVDGDRAEWAQRFSWDDGATWDDVNYTFTHTRVGPPGV
ncbi:hypothetical protein [Longispora fulva]|uniref:DUF1579 domain-containing protein n=1 Tax=Longispora fulva TaxID=619741 RepID=A0A8J7GBX7_9ACTN|nr:hypothetical protein [Longispora fulva]MBG6134711.1 hypothetical protein [Longispora fulva]